MLSEKEPYGAGSTIGLCVFMTKPDAEIYELCLQRNKLLAKESIFVDDVALNCDAAKSVDMLAHQFLDAKSLRSELISLGCLTHV